MSLDLRTIKLGGVLGKKFGRVHKLAVATPAEAIRALCVLHQGFREFLERSHENGIGYKFVIGKDELKSETLKDDVHIERDAHATFMLSPVMVGSKSSFGQILLGAVLVVAAFWTAGWSLAAMGTFGSSMAMMGASMILGGVSQMLSPTPKAGEPREADANKPSYLFNGAVNTVAQGQPVPILYGKLIVGSAVVSAGITSQDIPL